MELDGISQPELEQIDSFGSADLLIGVLGAEDGAEGGDPLAMTREALAGFPHNGSPLRAMVLSANGAHAPAAASPEAGNGVSDNVLPDIVSVGGLPLIRPGETPQQSISQAYRRVFAIGGKLGVRACGVIASRSQAGARQWISRLVQPVMNLGFDLVAPCYTRQKMEGLLNRSVLSPLHRALYGEQLQNPMGPDFGISGKLLQQLLRQDAVRKRGAEGNALVSIASAAACGGFQVCESHLGLRIQQPTDWANLSSLLAEILGPMFLEMEGRAANWQSIRGSKVLPRFGAPEPATPDPAAAPIPSSDVHGMIESFQLGAQNLQDVWGLILPPATLLELKRLSRLPESQFRLPDHVWVRIVFDFALGHRLRTISRDHLLRSITPLYLGWIASYAIEMQTAGPEEVEARLERLAKAYEENKSYLVSRWRWPDRFNP